MKLEVRVLLVIICILIGELILSFNIFKNDNLISYTNYEASNDPKIKLLSQTEDISQKYEITLNKEVLNLDITYTNNLANNTITGVFNEITLYTYNYQDNNKVYTNKFINELFNTSNFEIIKGEDNKEYLTIRTYNNQNGWISLYIFNDKLECLKEFTITNKYLTLEVDTPNYIWYKDSFNICNNECQIRLKIDNNKIYTLIYDSSKLEVEARTYTIKDNLFKYEVSNTYDVINIKESV